LDVLFSVLVIVVCLATEAFFSGAEIGVVSAGRMRLRHAAAQGSRGARLALSMLEKPEWLLSTTLVGTNISVVMTTTTTTALVIHLFGEENAWLAIVVAAPLVWIFGEIVAKSVFQQRADRLTPKVAYILRAASFLFFPVLLVFSALTRILTRMVGDTGDGRSPFTLREEIASMMEMSKVEGDVLPVEKQMIRRLFDFSETTARDVLVPLIDVVAVEGGATVGRARRLAAGSAHERLPVYDGRVDRVVGQLDAIDLLLLSDDDLIEPHVRPVHFVPGARSIEAVLTDLRQRGEELAIIVDEFGGAEGILTIEDILEQVVGELTDEFDEEAPDLFHKLGERDYRVDARVELDYVRRELGVALPDGKYETLGGFLLELAQEIPAEGAEFEHRGIQFLVLRANATAIHEVRMTWG